MVKACINPGAYAPRKRSDGWADLFALERKVLPPHGHVIADTGVEIIIPQGHTLLVRSDPVLMKESGVISEYMGGEGTVKVALFNLGHAYRIFNPGDRVAMCAAVRTAVMEFETFTETAGGDGCS